MYDAARLTALRTRSLRRGIWFRALTRLERAQVDLTVRMVRTVRSLRLATVLDRIVAKLSAALESRVQRAIQSVGYPLAQKLSRIAQQWGHPTAEAWAHDVRLARFLAVQSINAGSLKS